MSGHVSSDGNVTQAGPITSGCERNNVISRLLISNTDRPSNQGPSSPFHYHKASQDGYRAAQVIRKRRRSPIDAAADRLIQVSRMRL
ncbi:hypothetical protein J1614_006364 [Plenodomus biglobosus]|nr:hypothetical protein J1614_006364 [Plenodomus biglobosus]